MSESSKQRRSRIDLGYYRRADAQSRRRGRLTIIALLIAGGWFAAAPIWGRGRDAGVRFFQHNSLASKGPLARPHAMWETHCEACHVAFTPVNGSRWSPSLRGGPNAGDESCRTCHAGPAHHDSQLAGEVPSCAECHRDHRGRDASLLAMDDSACTSCHQELARHRDPSVGAMRTAASATRFTADPSAHPAFTPPAGVPGPESGRVKFSHARHMARGLAPESGGIPFTLASLEQPDRTRYGVAGGRDDGPIQLRCDSCHRLDRGDGPAVSRTAGDAMLPITYENDCRACHPLAFDPKDPKRTILHGLKPAAVVERLRQFYAAQAVEADPALLRRPVPPRPIPGRPASDEAARADKAAADRTLAALRRLFGSAVEEGVRSGQGLPLGRGGCVECHELVPSSRPLVDLGAAATLDIKPVVVRSIWYEGAIFHHATHRALDCASCHAGASEAKDQTQLLLPDVGRCVSCHAPATTEGGRPRGGAGTACVECHRYHDGDHPARGVGAAARRGKAAMNIEQFLDGGPRREGRGRDLE